MTSVTSRLFLIPCRFQENTLASQPLFYSVLTTNSHALNHECIIRVCKSDIKKLNFFVARQAMAPDPYRGPWGGKACRNSLIQVKRHCECPEGGECEAATLYADQLEEVLRYTCSYKRVAAFFTESIQVETDSLSYFSKYLLRICRAIY